MKKSAHDRLLAAALKVFSRDGWQSATTKGIALQAGVNEVTLFRLFGSKEKLLVEVIRQFVGKKHEILDQGIEKDLPMREVLQRFADAYHGCISDSADFIRVSLGEYARDPARAREVMSGIVKPMRSRFLAFLQEHQKKGAIRRDVNCETALDLFIGMLFSHVVRPQLAKVSYTAADYRRDCVELFVRGVSP